MGTFDDIMEIVGATTPSATQDSSVYQSKIVALSRLADELRRYDESGDATSLKEFKQKISLQSSLLKAKAQLLTAGVSGSSREKSASIGAASREAVQQMRSYTDIVNQGYDRRYGGIVQGIVNNHSNDAPGPEKTMALWDDFLQGRSPSEPGLNRALKQATEALGTPVTSSRNAKKLADIQAAAADQDAKEQQAIKAISMLESSAGGESAMTNAVEAYKLLEADYGLSATEPPPGETSESASAKMADEKNLERIQDSYDRLSKDVFGGTALDEYGGMTEEEWNTVIGSPQYQRFAREHGFAVGRVDNGQYVAGAQDHRAVSAFIRAEQGGRVYGTIHRPEDTYVQLDVAGSEPGHGWSHYADETGAFYTDKNGVYLTPDQADELRAKGVGPHPKYEEIGLTKMAADNATPLEGYVKHIDGSIDYIDFKTGKHTQIADKDGVFRSPTMQANMQNDFAKAGSELGPVGVKGATEPMSSQELVDYLKSGRSLDDITDMPDAAASESDLDPSVIKTTQPPTGAHAVYGKVLPHRPSDSTGIVRISTVGGNKVFRETTDAQTGKKVYVPADEQSNGFELPDSARVLSGGGQRQTFGDVQAARVGANNAKLASAADRFSTEPNGTLFDPKKVMAAQRAAGFSEDKAPVGEAQRVSADDALQRLEAETALKTTARAPDQTGIRNAGTNKPMSLADYTKQLRDKKADEQSVGRGPLATDVAIPVLAEQRPLEDAAVPASKDTSRAHQQAQAEADTAARLIALEQLRAQRAQADKQDAAKLAKERADADAAAKAASDSASGVEAAAKAAALRSLRDAKKKESSVVKSY